MRRSIFILLIPLILSGCVEVKPFPDVDTEPMPPSSSSSISSLAASSADQALEQLPPELTIESFKNMRLIGTGFTIVKTLDENSAYTRHQIQYFSNGLKISGIANIPKGSGPFPIAILNHGYIDPAIYTNGRGLKREQDFLARQGFVVIHSDYRGHAFSDPSPDTVRKVYDAGLEYSMDIVNLIDAVKRGNFSYMDTSRIGMLGHSMGGGVTLNIAVAFPDLVDAVVLYAPVNADAYLNFDRWRRERDEDDRTLIVMKERSENPAAWDALSSKAYLSDITAPILLFQGSNDKDVPKAWSDDLAVQLEALKKDFTYIEYPGEGHEFGPKWNDFMQKTAEFFRTHSK